MIFLGVFVKPKDPLFYIWVNFGAPRVFLFYIWLFLKPTISFFEHRITILFFNMSPNTPFFSFVRKTPHQHINKVKIWIFWRISYHLETFFCRKKISLQREIRLSLNSNFYRARGKCITRWNNRKRNISHFAHFQEIELAPSTVYSLYSIFMSLTMLIILLDSTLHKIPLRIE